MTFLLKYDIRKVVVLSKRKKGERKNGENGRNPVPHHRQHHHPGGDPPVEDCQEVSAEEHRLPAAEARRHQVHLQCDRCRQRVPAREAAGEMVPLPHPSRNGADRQLERSSQEREAEAWRPVRGHLLRPDEPEERQGARPGPGNFQVKEVAMDFFPDLDWTAAAIIVGLMAFITHYLSVRKCLKTGGWMEVGPINEFRWIFYEASELRFGLKFCFVHCILCSMLTLILRYTGWFAERTINIAAIILMITQIIFWILPAEELRTEKRSC